MKQEWTEEKKDEMEEFQDFIDLYFTRIKKGVYRPNDSDKRQTNGDVKRFKGGC